MNQFENFSVCSQTILPKNRSKINQIICLESFSILFTKTMVQVMQASLMEKITDERYFGTVQYNSKKQTLSYMSGRQILTIQLWSKSRLYIFFAPSHKADVLTMM